MSKFDIGDIVDLLGLTRLKGGNKYSINAVCPFCGDDRGKMNLCIRKDGKEVNGYHCYNCDRGGGQLDLYMELTGFRPENYEERYSEAYHEVVEKLNLNVTPTVRAKKTQEKVKHGKDDCEIEMKKANVYDINRTYRQMLKLLSLKDAHSKDLRRRGLSDADIERYLFRSTPADDSHAKSICRQLLKCGCTLKGVPGFYQDDHGNWTMNVYPQIQGYLCPVINDLTGLIAGFQIRLDQPFRNMKYGWLTSANKKNGVSAGSPALFLGKKDAQEVGVTEGILKGIVYHCLTGKSIIGVPGVSNIKGGLAILSQMPEMKTVHELYDMDKFENTVCHTDYKPEKCRNCLVSDGAYCPKKAERKKSIEKFRNKLVNSIQSMGMTCVGETWDLDDQGIWKGNYKGIDDYELSRKEQ